MQNLVRNHVQNHVKNHAQNHVQNNVRKNKTIANKNMSFQKITDPKKKDFIVNEFLKTMQNIQQTFYQNVQETWAHNTNFQSSTNQLRTCRNN